MSDRSPLTHWSHGRVTLMGDAAHPMYPFGGNGAAQAILDAKSLGHALATCGVDSVAGLARYEGERLQKANAVVMANRQGGPERVIDVVMSRLTGSEQSVDTVVSVDERRAIVRGYSQVAGYSPDSLKKIGVLDVPGGSAAPARGLRFRPAATRAADNGATAHEPVAISDGTTSRRLKSIRVPRTETAHIKGDADAWR